MINPNKTHRAHGTVTEVEQSGSLKRVSIKLDNGHVITSQLYTKELPTRYKLTVGQVVNFQSRFSIVGDQYIITKIGSLKVV